MGASRTILSGRFCICRQGFPVSSFSSVKTAVTKGGEKARPRRLDGGWGVVLREPGSLNIPATLRDTRFKQRNHLPSGTGDAKISYFCNTFVIWMMCDIIYLSLIWAFESTRVSRRKDFTFLVTPGRWHLYRAYGLLPNLILLDSVWNYRLIESQRLTMNCSTLFLESGFNLLHDA